MGARLSRRPLHGANPPKMGSSPWGGICDDSRPMADARPGSCQKGASQTVARAEGMSGRLTLDAQRVHSCRSRDQLHEDLEVPKLVHVKPGKVECRDGCS